MRNEENLMVGKGRHGKERTIHEKGREGQDAERRDVVGEYSARMTRSKRVMGSRHSNRRMRGRRRMKNTRRMMMMTRLRR